MRIDEVTINESYATTRYDNKVTALEIVTERQQVGLRGHRNVRRVRVRGENGRELILPASELAMPWAQHEARRAARDEAVKPAQDAASVLRAALREWGLAGVQVDTEHLGKELDARTGAYVPRWHRVRLRMEVDEAVALAAALNRR